MVEVMIFAYKVDHLTMCGMMCTVWRLGICTVPYLVNRNIISCTPTRWGCVYGGRSCGTSGVWCFSDHRYSLQWTYMGMSQFAYLSHQECSHTPQVQNQVLDDQMSLGVMVRSANKISIVRMRPSYMMVAGRSSWHRRRPREETSFQEPFPSELRGEPRQVIPLVWWFSIY